MLCSGSCYNLKFQVYAGKIWNKTETWLGQMWCVEWMNVLILRMYLCYCFYFFLCFWYCTNCHFIFICLLHNVLLTIPTASCYCISSFHLGFLSHVFFDPSLPLCVSFTMHPWVSYILHLWDELLAFLLKQVPCLVSSFNFDLPQSGGPTRSNASAFCRYSSQNHWDSHALQPCQEEAQSGV
jgi:hypothetical protein